MVIQDRRMVQELQEGRCWKRTSNLHGPQNQLGPQFALERENDIDVRDAVTIPRQTGLAMTTFESGQILQHGPRENKVLPVCGRTLPDSCRIRRASSRERIVMGYDWLGIFFPWVSEIRIPIGICGKGLAQIDSYFPKKIRGPCTAASREFRNLHLACISTGRCIIERQQCM